MLVTFDISFDGAFWCARGMGVDIFTQGMTLDELMQNVKDAVELHFEETIDAGEQITVVSLTELLIGSKSSGKGSSGVTVHLCDTDPERPADPSADHSNTITGMGGYIPPSSAFCRTSLAFRSPDH